MGRRERRKEPGYEVARWMLEVEDLDEIVCLD